MKDENEKQVTLRGGHEQEGDGKRKKEVKKVNIGDKFSMQD
jgi:hypothetical protein